MARENEFINTLLSSPANPAEDVVKPKSGVYSVDILRACLKLCLSPPMFMKSLSDHQRDSFSVEKKIWSHFVFVRKITNQGEMVQNLTTLVLKGVKSFQKEQLLKLDCC